jgi:hypothetical protein
VEALVDGEDAGEGETAACATHWALVPEELRNRLAVARRELEQADTAALLAPLFTTQRVNALEELDRKIRAARALQNEVIGTVLHAQQVEAIRATGVTE